MFRSYRRAIGSKERFHYGGKVNWKRGKRKHTSIEELLSFYGEEFISTKCFLKSAYLPKVIRNMISCHELEVLPTTKDLRVIMIMYGFPGLIEMTEMYLDSNIFAMDDVLIDVNVFLEPVIKALYAEGGDILRFTNCCLNVLWEIQEDTDLPSLLHSLINACDCTQRSYSQKTHSLGIDSFAHIGVSLGDASFVFVGDPAKRILWYQSGPAVDLAFSAYSSCDHDNIVVSRSVWEQISKYKSDYTWKMIEDDLVKITKKNKLKKYKPPVIVPATSYKKMKEFEDEHFDCIQSLIHPLPRTALTYQQVAILSCITQVCVGAAYLKNFDSRNLEKLQKATIVLCDLIDKYEGVMSKVIEIERLNFGFYFGCPGYKHHNDTVRALLWAKDAVEKMKELNIELVVSLSTGMCFFGVIGNHYRFECSIFGKPISYALKMVQSFTDLSIVCDISTVLRSRRDVGDIFEQAKKRTRGAKGIPLCYTVNFSKQAADSELTCVGHEDLKKEIIQALNVLKGNAPRGKLLPLMIIHGTIGMGKTTMLKWVAQESRKLGFRALADLANVYFDDPLDRIWGIVREILASNYLNTEVCVMEILGVNARSYPLHMLNKHLNTKFRQQCDNPKDDYMAQIGMLVQFVKFVARFKNKPLLLAIDDAELLGQEGWLFLKEILYLPGVVLVLSFRDPMDTWGNKFPFVADIIDQAWAKYDLAPLSKDDTITLACSFLDVVAIHQDVSSILLAHSQGNPLRIQEILLLPQIQRHFCLVKYQSIMQSTLEDSFVMAKAISAKKERLRVCDILDPEGLRKVYIPQKLLDVVREHTIGLDTEEQMLIKKCALLGQRFGLYLLEVVCPEYTSTSLRYALAKLVDKYILSISCDHLKVEQKILRESLSDVELVVDFCEHPLTFTSQQFQKCIYEIMPQGQKERFHLVLSDLIKEAGIGCVCGSCRRYSGSLILPASTHMNDITALPMLTLSTCQCSDYKMAFYTQLDYHLKLGDAPVSYRIKFLFQACEAAVRANNQSKLEVFLSMAEKLSEFRVVSAQKNLSPEEFSPILAECLIKSLRAMLCICLGNIKDAVENVTSAFAALDVRFPLDYLLSLEISCKGCWKLNAFEVERERIISKALTVGCICLIIAGKLNEAYKIAKVLQEFVERLEDQSDGEKFPTFSDKVRTKSLLLVAGSKTSSKSAKHVGKYSSEILKITAAAFRNPSLDTVDLRVVIRARSTLVEVFFERGDLTNAQTIGSRIFHMTKILHGQIECCWIMPVLFMVYFHTGNLPKCFEISSELLDIAHTTGDILTEAMYHGLLVLIMQDLDSAEIRIDKMKMLNEFATSKYTTLLPVRNRNKKLWVSALIALWCYEHNILEIFEMWKNAAVTFRSECFLTGFWSVDGAITLLRIEIMELKHKITQQRAAYWDTHIENLKKELAAIESQAKQVAQVTIKKISETKSMIKNLYKV